MKERLAHHIRGQLFTNHPLADYTSWRVGGPADFVLVPQDADDVVQFLKNMPEDLPLLWIGLGSNVLIRDGGVRGAAIITQGALHKIEAKEDHIIFAEAGVACAQIARHTARLGLTGLEFMAGIPGTVGGALAMNAGCFGGETWQVVQAVDVVNHRGEKKHRLANEYQIGYRSVKRPAEEWFLGGYFILRSGDKEKSLADIRTLLEKRNTTQPTGLPNCGSVFRNPPGNFAGRLIEQSGLKGKKIGGACVSDKHANFIINEHNATANDIETLIDTVKEIIQREHGISLIQEVCIIGERL